MENKIQVVKPKVIKQTNAVDTKNFKVDSFKCNHCQSNRIKKQVVDKLQQLRDYIGEPIFVISGYRCKRHNTDIGSGIKSYTEGKCADIRVVKEDGTWISSQELGELIEESGVFDNDTVVLYKTYVHIEISETRVRLDKSL